MRETTSSRWKSVCESEVVRYLDVVTSKFHHNGMYIALLSLGWDIYFCITGHEERGSFWFLYRTGVMYLCVYSLPGKIVYRG